MRTSLPRPRGPLAPAAGLLAAALVLSGCQEVQTSAPAEETADVTTVTLDGRTIAEGGDLVMALSAEPDVLDPTTSSSLYTRYVMETMCEKLYDVDEAGEIVPMLATELPEVSDDGLTVTFPVMEGVQFADGTPFDAEAVKTSIERHLTKEDSSRRSELGPIEEVTALDDSTVEITYETPFAPLTAVLADRAGMIMSPTELEKAGDGFGEHPVCVGAFKFVERVPQTSITVERDPLYYDAENVHLDSITYRIITDASIRAANLRSGDVQVADTISTQDLAELEDDENVGLLEVGSLGYQAMTVNVGNTDGVGNPPGEIDTPIAQDPRIRQALSMAVDREQLVKSVFNDRFDPACSPVSPASPFTSEASEACPEYDPEGAKALLEEAGADVPYEIEIKVTNTPDTLRLAQAVQASVADGGFDLTIVPVEYSSLLEVQEQGDFDLLQLGWSGRVDPHGNMFNFLSTGAGNNYSGYSNPEVDDLLTQAATVIDPAERAELYGQVVTQVQQDNPIIYLYRTRSLTGYADEVAGISTYADGVVRLSNAAFVDPAEG
ncbi:ABC transporter substrate-binding protein [Promicromonospora sukumoe]|uniref:Peptide/nickel transport system substrate-binding protein n=1 Tax=Promicromonospora sukumoe TaxID=88382 RepID=A0A7W3PFC3_9MICO|nr:ABC transporter substrate-binding protein [Promicromonospora sukumoe]MBA8809970.1 peptide/nickel transport system substrate-binding protein [Promicromonospora sukumoe]